MTFKAEDIAKKYDGQLIGGAVVATIDGKKEYLTVFRDGTYVPTDLLLSLEATTEAPAQEVKPKKATKKAEVKQDAPVIDDLDAALNDE